MSSDSRSPEEIERDIARERIALADAVSVLQQRFSVEGLAHQFANQVSRHGSDIGNSVGRSAKENPIALALTGIGLAWMMFGSGPGRDRGNGHYRAEHHDVKSVPPYDTEMSRHMGVGDATGTGGGSDDTSWSASASRAASAASHGWDRFKSAVGGYGRSTRASAEDMRRRLSEGTENLTEEARQRVIAAREAAWRAQADLEERTRHGLQDARRFYLEQPLVVGALAVAAGAAIGAMLPRTRTEDEALGARSDHLFEEADRVYREEMEKVREVAKAATGEARNIAREKKAEADRKAPAGKTAAGEAGDRIKSATQRVARAAKDEAKRQDLGRTER